MLTLGYITTDIAASRSSAEGLRVIRSYEAAGRYSTYLAGLIMEGIVWVIWLVVVGSEPDSIVATTIMGNDSFSAPKPATATNSLPSNPALDSAYQMKQPSVASSSQPMNANRMRSDNTMPEQVIIAPATGAPPNLSQNKSMAVATQRESVATVAEYKAKALYSYQGSSTEEAMQI